ncbi:MAG: PKD domain-containing protein [Sphingobacteriia bacterium]|nr:PKD domain-containing protein [Sphingobacteriia bacterium]
MKKTLLILFCLIMQVSFPVQAVKNVPVPCVDQDGAVKEIFTLVSYSSYHLVIGFSLKNTTRIARHGLQTMIAVPDGAIVKLKAVNFGTVLLLENEFSTDQFFRLSEMTVIRGLQVVILSVNPFLKTPLHGDELAFTDALIEIEFQDGNGNFGNNRLRSRWFDPVLAQQIINYCSLPQISFERKFVSGQKETGAEYLIISPDDPVFRQWGDSLQKFRTRQGILTIVVSLSDIGGNNPALIEAYIDNAYNNWEIPPAGVLLLGDNGSTAMNTVAAPVWDNYCVSDNVYADVTGNGLPDVIISRITAKNGVELENIVSKIISYERNPSVNPAFYQHPVTSCQFVPSGISQLVTEPLAGFFEVVQAKSANRINVAPDPLPEVWSESPFALELINLFGPNGLGYIPETPGQVNCNWAGTTSDFIDGINSGAFLLLHKGQSAGQSWIEPPFSSQDINSLTNADPVLVLSFGSLTGKFNTVDDCLAEHFLNHSFNGNPSGAIGVLAASEVTYNFVSDIFALGVLDCIFPDFIPQTPTYFEDAALRPAIANAAGKYYLHSSTYPVNPAQKEMTYHVFHYFGDVFTSLFSEMPQELNIAHNPGIMGGNTVFEISADEGSLIGLSVNGELIATATGTGELMQITIPPQFYPDNIDVVVTKPNHYRYEAVVMVYTETLTAWFIAANPNICSGDSVYFTDSSAGMIVSREWIFEGGVPETSSLANPTIFYPEPGYFDVTLIVSNGITFDTLTIDDYIGVDNCLGYEEIPEKTRLKVFPVPSDGVVYLDFEEVYGQINLKIFNPVSGFIYELNKRLAINETLMVDLSVLPDGVYFFTANAGGKSFNGKILIRNAAR